jgi:hypothetical protein
VFQEREKKEGGKGKLECPIYRGKNRDTGGVICMESYVGNTPPNERFLLWDMYLCVFWGPRPNDIFRSKKYWRELMSGPPISNYVIEVTSFVKNKSEHACS